MMSLIVALLGKNCGVVASDSIMVSPQGDVSFDFDKTFSIQIPLMIAAHAGLLEFAGIKISDHVRAITMESRFGNIRATADRIASELIKKLYLSEISFESKKVELLILSRKKFSSGRYEIRSIALKPNPNTGSIDYSNDLYHGTGSIVHLGDDQARKYLMKFINPKRHKIPAMNRAQLKQIAVEAIKYAIPQCGKHPLFPNIPACGGHPCAITI